MKKYILFRAFYSVITLWLLVTIVFSLVRLSGEIQRALIDGYYFVPIYMNPFVHAVGPRVLPAGDGFHRYWNTKNAPYPYPWEDWLVKTSG